MTDQGPGDSKGKTSGGMYNTASTSSRCLIAAGVIGLVVLSLIIIEMLFVPIWNWLLRILFTLASLPRRRFCPCFARKSLIL